MPSTSSNPSKELTDIKPEEEKVVEKILMLTQAYAGLKLPLEENKISLKRLYELMMLISERYAHLAYYPIDGYKPINNEVIAGYLADSAGGFFTGVIAILAGDKKGDGIVDENATVEMITQLPGKPPFPPQYGYLH